MLNSAAVVVLLNPDNEVTDNIARYSATVTEVICVDNSDANNYGLLSKIKNVKYFPQYKNTGISFALNFGCNKAIEDGCSVITTFDQDTVCPGETLLKLIELASTKEALYSPNLKHIYRDSANKRIMSDDIINTDHSSHPDWVITSGCTFSSALFQELNGFDEKLFVGQVDQDFSFRVHKAGYETERILDIYEYQEAGKTKVINLLIKKIHISNLSAFRYYYIFRNERYLRNKYGRDYQSYYVSLWKYIISILFFEEDKYKKMRAIIRGWIDGKSL